MTIDVSLIPQNRVENLISKLSEIENNIGNIGTDITNNVVHRIGDETISGEKTFQNNITAPNQIDYTNITNCITEIPQDIKLELNNGTLTLKAGSKVYVPNGAGVFDAITIPNNKTFTATGSSNSKVFAVYYPNDGTIKIFLPQNIESGTSYNVTDGIWYDTTNNSIKRITSGSVAYSGISFPICVLQLTSGTITSIDQVFNGFGYIGSTVFALPGVKGRIPNGRNEDGSLKSIEYTLDKVLTETFPNLNVPVYVTLKTNSLDYWQVAVTPIAYSETENIFINGNNVKSSELILGISYLSSGKITSFIPKTIFHALDYNDFSDLKNTVDTNDSNVVHRTGNETISGNKTFTGSNPIVLQNNSGKNTTLTLKDSTTSYGTSAVDFVQATSNNFNQLLIHFKEGNKWCTNWDQDPTSKNIKIYFTGSEAVFAPTPATSSNSTQIVTTNWSRIVHPLYPNITTSTRVSVPADTDYSIPYDCWVWWGNTSYVGVRYLYVNGIEFGHSYGNSGHWEEFNTLFFPIKVGNVIRHTGGNSTCFLYQNVY